MSVSLLLAAVAGAPLANAQPDDLVVSTDETGRTISVESNSVRQVTDREVAARFGGVGQLKQSSVRALPAGSAVRLQQELDGVPVFGGQVVQTKDPSGALVAAVGKTAQRSAGQFPADTAQAVQRATASAVERISKDKSLAADTVKAGNSTAYWYDSSLADDTKTSAAVPAYEVVVSGVAPEDRWAVMVDATTGTVLTITETNKNATNRVVCDANSAKIEGKTEEEIYIRSRCGTAFRPARTEGDSPAALADVNSVYDFFGDTSKLYGKQLNSDLTQLIGVDYGDGNGKALRATVRACIPAADPNCPMTNAFWTGEQMVFGEGVTTDDITGHEMTHGVTERISGLVYKGQSGALNEAVSDIFGEFVDLTNGSQDDLAANRWKMGEGSSLGVIRDMANPKAYQQPDQVNGQYWFPPDLGFDSGGVHINSGIANRAASLIADGGKVGGQEVLSIGLTKSVQLWWTVQNQLTPSATFRDLAKTLQTSCKLNARAAIAGTTTQDCVQVDQAIKATKLTAKPKLSSDFSTKELAKLTTVKPRTWG